MERPMVGPDYRDAVHVLIGWYADLLQPGELLALWRMNGRPALSTTDRLRLSIIARIALDRAAAREAPYAA